MAQGGDTITYTFSDGTSVAEDVSGIDEVVIDYLHSAGGQDNSGTDNPASSGGAVENTVVDVSNISTLYIWVSGGDRQSDGRYDGGVSTFEGGGSTEVAAVDTNSDAGPTEPFIVAGGGGGGGFDETRFNTNPGGGGARGGAGTNPLAGDGKGDPPPVGGDAATSSSAATVGDGAVSGHGSSVPIVDSGTTTAGGGAAPNSNGEIQVTYESALSPPDPPSNLSAEVQ